MRARRARASDAEAIYQLIAHYADLGLLLPRSQEEIRRHIGHFLVREAKDQIIGCLALETYGSDLAEIRSLAVRPEIRGRGIGAQMIEQALVEVRRRDIARVFAVTRAPEFFLRHGFATTARQSLTEKIERDCRPCPKRRSCNLIAVIATVIPERLALPILDDSVTLISAA
jgi:N-acetylglutamate synthase-like GNAT family acetyltransferase